MSYDQQSLAFNNVEKFPHVSSLGRFGSNTLSKQNMSQCPQSGITAYETQC